MIRSDNGLLGIEFDATFEELAHPDVIVFPGGVGTRALMKDERVLDWVRTAHATTTFTTSVCTGSLVLGAAGLLEGLTATTHWSVLDRLAQHGATPTGERVVEHLDRRIITAAGVSAGIDMALRLVELLFDRTAAEASQLMIEYDPQPPFDAGSTAKVGAEVVDRVIEYAAATHVIHRRMAPCLAGLDRSTCSPTSRTTATGPLVVLVRRRSVEPSQMQGRFGAEGLDESVGAP